MPMISASREPFQHRAAEKRSSATTTISVTTLVMMVRESVWLID